MSSISHKVHLGLSINLTEAFNEIIIFLCNLKQM